MIVIPDVGQVALLNRLLKQSAPEDLQIRLFRNDYIPAQNSALSSFTEANFTNYSAKTLTKSGWSTTIVAPTSPCTNNEAHAVNSQVDWTCGSIGNTIYGYYVVGNTSGDLLWADRFSTSRELSDGDVVSVIPTFNLRTAIECS